MPSNVLPALCCGVNAAGAPSWDELFNIRRKLCPSWSSPPFHAQPRAHSRELAATTVSKTATMAPRLRKFSQAPSQARSLSALRGRACGCRGRVGRHCARCPGLRDIWRRGACIGTRASTTSSPLPGPRRACQCSVSSYCHCQ